jgi:hypothetical protein
MSKQIGIVGGHAVGVDGNGVYITPVGGGWDHLSTERARALAFLLLQAADEVEKMRGDRAALGNASDAARLKPVTAGAALDRVRLPSDAPKFEPAHVKIKGAEKGLLPGDYQMKFVSYNTATNEAIYEIVK